MPPNASRQVSFVTDGFQVNQAVSTFDHKYNNPTVAKSRSAMTENVVSAVREVLHVAMVLVTEFSAKALC